MRVLVGCSPDALSLADGCCGCATTAYVRQAVIALPTSLLPLHLADTMHQGCSMLVMTGMFTALAADCSEAGQGIAWGQGAGMRAPLSQCNDTHDIAAAAACAALHAYSRAPCIGGAGWRAPWLTSHRLHVWAHHMSGHTATTVGPSCLHCAKVCVCRRMLWGGAPADVLHTAAIAAARCTTVNPVALCLPHSCIVGVGCRGLEVSGLL